MGGTVGERLHDEADEEPEEYDPERVRRAREALSHGDAVVGVRRDIAASWRRSSAHGVPRTTLRAPYDERVVDLESPLVRAADPVLAQSALDLGRSASCIALADHRGRILRRVTGDPRFDAALDRVLLAPGFSYSERHVGTNGLGTALHDRTLVVVHGREHFNDELTDICCFAVPVRDPLTGRVLGAVGIGAATTADEGAYTAVVRQAGLLVENRLFDLHTDGQRELYGAYLAALRQGRQHAFVLAPDLLRAPPVVMQHLGAVGHDQLWALAVDALGNRREAQVQVPLADGAVVGVRLRAFEHRGRLAGALGEVRPAGDSTLSDAPAGPALPLREYAGWSAATRTAAVALRRLAEAWHPVVVLGEVGTGKASMVQLVAARVFPGRPLLTLTPEDLSSEGGPQRVAEHLETGAPVLVRQVDTLGPEQVAALLEATADARRQGWLAMTWRGDPDASATVPRGTGLRVLTLAPLRSRPDDIPRAVERMLLNRPQGRHVTFTPALVERLRREPWPRNLAGLSDVVEELLACRHGTVVDVGVFDEAFQATVRRRLTPVEWMLRAAIVDALRAHGGNKDLAAAALGMSRASIYRKLKSLDIDVADAVRG